ncbi:amino acid ABC transporter substrate-binding protein [Acidovorax sp. A1169]|uniref:amino acid ABC transporter substrate-binding protein n=1 Tax=Acidovorax sp. A1169 TaxID=3059524 RepID=UPI002737A04E|nr:amino acid ABC transporter substrate-binding protein [Acidovorax sp. A1169]MDP4078971.1 amino acid ABC transporter substrate-binding protein [Acidovorax sp. A1169]
MLKNIAKLSFFCSAAVFFSAAAHSEILNNIRERGVVRLAHRENSAPFSYVDNSGNVLGFTVELCKRIISSLETSKKEPLRIQWVKVSLSDRGEALKNGRADMECGSTTNNAERRREYLFSAPIYIAGIKILSQKGDSTDDLNQLFRKRVAVAKGTTAFKLVDMSNRERLSHIAVNETLEHEEAWSLLRGGKVDAWLADDVILATHRASVSNPQDFYVSKKFLSVEPYGIVLRLEDSDLLKSVNKEIFRLMRSGEFRAIYDTWFQKPIPGKNFNLKLPMNEILKAQVSSPSESLPPTY